MCRAAERLLVTDAAAWLRQLDRDGREVTVMVPVATAATVPLPASPVGTP
jgi:hypothetical protein